MFFPRDDLLGEHAIPVLERPHERFHRLAERTVTDHDEPEITQRDGLPSDIAAAFRGLGLHDAAPDGYLIVAAAAQSQWVRWQPTLNLMELAALGRRLGQFERNSNVRFMTFFSRVDAKTAVGRYKTGIAAEPNLRILLPSQANCT